MFIHVCLKGVYLNNCLSSVNIYFYCSWLTCLCLCACLYTCVGPIVTPRYCPRRSCVTREWLQLNLKFRRKWISTSHLSRSPHRWGDFSYRDVQSLSTCVCQVYISIISNSHWLCCYCCWCLSILLFLWWGMWYKMMFFCSPQQENAVGGTVEENEHVITGADATVVSHTPSLSQPKGKEQLEVLTNEIIVGKGKDKHGHPGGSVYLTEIQHMKACSDTNIYVCAYCISSAFFVCIPLHITVAITNVCTVHAVLAFCLLIS